MANTKKATYKIFNGTDWDTYYFKTSADQVGETSNLKFLHLDTHKVNGIAFSASSGITLSGEDIISGGGTSLTVAERFGAIENGTTVVGKATSDKDGYDISTTYVKVADYNVNMSNKVDKNSVGVANGVASLGSDGKVPSSQLPSYVDDVIEGYYKADEKRFMDSNMNTLEGAPGKIYVDRGTNKTYRWSGSDYVLISSSLALGETSSTAYAGDKGASIKNTLDSITNGLYSVPKATSDSQGNNIVEHYLSKSTAGTTYATKTEISEVTNEIQKIYTGSEPSTKKKGDIWLEY